MRALRARLPAEFHRDIPAGPLFGKVNNVLDVERLNTICESGKCPNRGECFSRGTLAFMILGDLCTRHCGFCAVKAGDPQGIIDWEEPERLARAVSDLHLRHVVITSVARDDLKDGGAGVFAQCVRQVRHHQPECIVEVLTPDFFGDRASLDLVLEAEPDIFNHNLETVERLTPSVRSKATYRRSLEVLTYARAHPSRALTARGEGTRRAGAGTMKIKSGIMLGLGETHEEVLKTLEDLRSAGCEYLTIGQYLQPSARHLGIQAYVPVSDFKHWEKSAYDLGFERVASGPLVRSSYFAENLHSPAGARFTLPDRVDRANPAPSIETRHP